MTTDYFDLALKLSREAAARVAKTHLGSCDFPNCYHEGEVLACYDCGGEFCFEHAEQEHYSCKALSPYA